MPAVVPFLGAVAGIVPVSQLGFAGAGLAVFAARIGIIGGLNYVAAKRSVKRQDAPMRGSNEMIRSTVSPQTIVYGDTVVGGTILFAGTNSIPDSTAQEYHLDLILAHCVGEVADITDVWIDDEHYVSGTDITWAGDIGTFQDTGKKYRPRDGVASAVVHRRLGTATQTNFPLLETAYPEYTADHRGRGWVLTWWRFTRHPGNHEDITSIPSTIRVKVSGRLCYDPRLDATPGADPNNPAFQTPSSNPAVCTADYMRNFMPVDATRIDWPSVVKSADTCDATVPIPTATTEKRYTCNGVLSLGATRRNNLEALLSSMIGTVAKNEGKWSIQAGEYEVPAVTIVDDDIVGPMPYRSQPTVKERFNTAKAVYRSRDDGYQDTESVTVAPSAFLTRDNNVVRERTFQLPFTDHETEAQRILFKQLDQNNQGGVAQAPLKWTGMNLMPGGTATLTYGPYGASFVNKVMRCTGWQQGENEAPIVAILKEDAPTAWDDPVEGDYTARGKGLLSGRSDPIVFNDLPDPSTLYGFYPLDRLDIIQNRTAATLRGSDKSAPASMVLSSLPGVISPNSIQLNQVAYDLLVTGSDTNDWWGGNEQSASCWFHPIGNGTDTTATVMFVDGTTGGNDWILYYDNTAPLGQGAISFFYPGGGTTQLSARMLNGWNYLEVSTRGTDIAVRINGNEVFAANDFAKANNTPRFRLGQTGETNGAYNACRLYRQWLTPAQSRTLFLQPGDTQGVAAEWGAGANLPDYGDLIQNSGMQILDAARNRPASVWLTDADDTQVGFLTYGEENGNRYAILGGAGSGTADLRIHSTAVKIQTHGGTTEPIQHTWRMRGDIAGVNVGAFVVYTTANMTTGRMFLSLGADAGPTYDEQFRQQGTGNTRLFNAGDFALNTGWTDYSAVVALPADVLWWGLELRLTGARPADSAAHIDFWPAGPNLGVLAPRDTVDTPHIEDDAVTQPKVAVGAIHNVQDVFTAAALPVSPGGGATVVQTLGGVDAGSDSVANTKAIVTFTAQSVSTVTGAEWQGIIRANKQLTMSLRVNGGNGGTAADQYSLPIIRTRVPGVAVSSGVLLGIPSDLTVGTVPGRIVGWDDTADYGDIETDAAAGRIRLLAATARAVRITAHVVAVGGSTNNQSVIMELEIDGSTSTNVGVWAFNTSTQTDVRTFTCDYTFPWDGAQTDIYLRLYGTSSLGNFQFSRCYYEVTKGGDNDGLEQDVIGAQFYTNSWVVTQDLVLGANLFEVLANDLTIPPGGTTHVTNFTDRFLSVDIVKQTD